MSLLVRYNLKLRQNNLYIHNCQPAPGDTAKTWAIYENYRADEKLDLAQMKIAVTPFTDAGGKRIIPEYRTAIDTTGVEGKNMLQIRAVIRAFQKLSLREVICAGPEVTYLVHKKFMLIFVFDAAKTPESIKNIATKLDENWYYQISFEHQDEQRRKLGTVLREFFDSVQAQKAQQQNETKK